MLGVAPTATAEQIRIAHRLLIKKHHPDTGGSSNAASAINASRDAAMLRKGWNYRHTGPTAPKGQHCSVPIHPPQAPQSPRNPFSRGEAYIPTPRPFSRRVSASKRCGASKVGCTLGFLIAGYFALLAVAVMGYLLTTILPLLLR